MSVRSRTSKQKMAPTSLSEPSAGNACDSKPDHIGNRDRVIRALQEELVGPAAHGEELDCSGPISFPSAAELYKPYVQKGSREEIISGERPRKRYGIGVLYPLEKKERLDNPDESTGVPPDTGIDQPVTTPNFDKKLEQIASRGGRGSEAESDDFDLSSANLMRQRSMGVSFLARFSKESQLVVNASGGRYRQKDATVGTDTRSLWLRSSVAIRYEFSGANILAKEGVVSPNENPYVENGDGLNVRVEVYSRPFQNRVDVRLLTVCLVNRTDGTKSDLPLDALCFFQAAFDLRVTSPAGDYNILPYPDTELTSPDNEEKSLMLLYRKACTYATGHGCAADWDAEASESVAKTVRAVTLPKFQVPSITPDIRRPDKSVISVSMAALAGLIQADDGLSSLEEILTLYSDWIKQKKVEAEALTGDLRDAADDHLEQCRVCLARMKQGFGRLQSDPQILCAFRLANHAVLLQQVHTQKEAREVSWDKDRGYLFSAPYPELDPLSPQSGRGKWRAFQIAFLLMSLCSAADGTAPDREVVDLIWFPTGGGKTEAYLGLSAFALFLRRMRDKSDTGVHVLMRYTLRLLTAQQFQRATGLICAMEYLRRDRIDVLGPNPFTIGIWLGVDTTPNQRKDAIPLYRALAKGDDKAEYKFVLTRCPWCGAQIGPLNRPYNRLPKHVSKVVGLDERGGTVIFRCPDTQCDFHELLPVSVIDEDLYASPTSLIIGTVDKFAMLAWRPAARALFGIGENGERRHSPPGLILQDELHLITGPLGSMVGLYEAVIEDLATDYRGKNPVRPKIVCSTATIRRYRKQIHCLYGRSESILFPPPGLDAGDSFFSRFAENDDGTLAPGRLYVGVHATGLGSTLTADVRTFSPLIQIAEEFAQVERDPWWTLLVFFNSIRELGAGLTLFQADIPERLVTIRRRLPKSEHPQRYLNNVLELTSRIPSSEIPQVLSELEQSISPTNRAVDVCLASSIIEVGIDVDRLSLMCVAGQPKTTSQYIQVTGRVGRRWWERPGLVVTIYSPTKPRDRSHYERFRSYHERLYAQVEPSSVTPFTLPALERALHAVIVAYVRQNGDMQEISRPTPIPADLVAQVRQLLEERVADVDSAELETFRYWFDKRLAEWKASGRTEWDALPDASNPPQLRPAGTHYPAGWEAVSWATPTSLRSVDAECQPQITLLYNQVPPPQMPTSSNGS